MKISNAHFILDSKNPIIIHVDDGEQLIIENCLFTYNERKMFANGTETQQFFELFDVETTIRDNRWHI